jgi:hypothetical protein
MARLKQINGYGLEVSDRYLRDDTLTLPDGNIVERGDMFKIRGKNSFGVGEWGLTFKFNYVVTDTKSGNVYVECFEMFRGRAGVMRAFPLDRVKRIPKKRVRKRKNVD